MKKTIIMPRKYIQGSGVLHEIGSYIELFGKRAAVIWDDVVRKILWNKIEQPLSQCGIDVTEISFGGECTKSEAGRIRDKLDGKKPEVILGAGGGKTLDTAKAVSSYMGLPLIIIPTIASTDSPTSAMSIWYTEDGEYEGVDFWKFNPDIVLVDTVILVKAPKRMFISGVGDALATWYETDASFKKRAVTMAGGTQTLTIMALARLCRETIIQYGKLAASAVDAKCVTPAFEKVIEATILLSGISFESGGLATAHALASILPNFFPEVHQCLHGEIVAFGLTCQLCLEEDLESDEINGIIDFMIEMGLPVSLGEINVKKWDSEYLYKMAEAAMSEIPFITNHNFPVTADSLYAAIVAGDRLGTERKELYRNRV